MFTLLIIAIIAGFILFFVTRKELSTNDITVKKQKTYKNINLIGLVILLMLFFANLFVLLSNLIAYNVSIISYIIGGFRFVVVYLLGIVSAILYIKSIKYIRSVKPIDNKPPEEKNNSQKNSANSLYYTSFKVMKTIFCILTAAVSFLIYGFIEEWDFGYETVVILLICSFAFSLIYTTVYFLPYKIASKKNHRQTRAIYILNIFAGWTIIIWVIALVWANTESKETVIINQAPTNISSSDELLNYKKLLDNGVITQEEFDAKKKQILGL